ncbi:MAG: sigma-54-dependent Fis family transcriptional regulator, partial [Gammaproteobacteria bacterium]|nr:sigma-54-dependent Fis family transcriptional regulator [Gammaproteobacteria bacterium]
PGNIRELENVLERALTLCTSGTIENHDIHIRKQRHKPSGESGKQPLTKHLDDVEKNAIVQALEKTRHNKTAAANLLGISFRQLRDRIKKLGQEEE